MFESESGLVWNGPDGGRELEVDPRLLHLGFEFGGVP
jgi:hypothetical protein